MIFLFVLDSFQCCQDSIDGMHEVFDELFHRPHSESNTELKSFLDRQRAQFHQMISSQQMLVINASIEPTFCWFKNPFSSSHYNLLVQQQIYLFRMLHNIDAAVSFRLFVFIVDLKSVLFLFESYYV